jgi:hypothetical protein
VLSGFAVLKIERISNPRVGYPHAGVFSVRLTATGIDEQPIDGKRDYSHANSIGSRGVHEWFFLQDGQVYHILSPQSWKRSDDYYCRVENRQIIRFFDLSEVVSWLSNHLA